MTRPSRSPGGYSTGEEHDAFSGECTLLSADPSGDHLFVQAFAFVRLDDGVFTPLPPRRT